MLVKQSTSEKQDEKAIVANTNNSTSVSINTESNKNTNSSASVPKPSPKERSKVKEGVAWKDVVAPNSSGTERRGGMKSNRGKRSYQNGGNSNNSKDSKFEGKNENSTNSQKPPKNISNVNSQPKSFDPSRSSALAPNRTHSAPPVEDHNLMQHKQSWQHHSNKQSSTLQTPQPTQTPPRNNQGINVGANIGRQYNQNQHHHTQQRAGQHSNASPGHQRPSPISSHSGNTPHHSPIPYQPQQNYGQQNQFQNTGGERNYHRSNQYDRSRSNQFDRTGSNPMQNQNQMNHQGNLMAMGGNQNLGQMPMPNMMHSPMMDPQMFARQQMHMRGGIPPQQMLFQPQHVYGPQGQYHIIYPGMFNPPYMPINPQMHQNRGPVMPINSMQRSGESHMQIQPPPREKKVLDIYNPETGVKVEIKASGQSHVVKDNKHLNSPNKELNKASKTIVDRAPSESEPTNEPPMIPSSAITGEMLNKFTAVLNVSDEKMIQSDYQLENKNYAVVEKPINIPISELEELNKATALELANKHEDKNASQKTEAEVGFSFGSFGGLAEDSDAKEEIDVTVTVENKSLGYEIGTSEFEISETEFFQIGRDETDPNAKETESNENIENNAMLNEENLTVDSEIMSEISLNVKKDTETLKIEEKNETDNLTPEKIENSVQIEVEILPNVVETAVPLTSAPQKSMTVCSSPTKNLTNIHNAKETEQSAKSDIKKEPSPAQENILSLRPGGGKGFMMGSLLPRSDRGVPPKTDLNQESTKISSAITVASSFKPSSEEKIVAASEKKKICYSKEELKQYSMIKIRPEGLTIFDISEENPKSRDSGRGPLGSGSSFRAGNSFRTGQNTGVSFSDRQSNIRNTASYGPTPVAHHISNQEKVQQWTKGKTLPPAAATQVGGKGSRADFQESFRAQIEPLQISANRWVPKKEADPLIAFEKTVVGILNKMTRDKFDRLSQQLLDISIESYDMLLVLIQAIFSKAIEEQFFSEMYADLCLKLHDNSGKWKFLKIVENTDANHFLYTGNVGVESEVIGPFKTIDEAIELASSDSPSIHPFPRPCKMEIVQLLIKNQKFIKILKAAEKEEREEEGEINECEGYYCIFVSEVEGRELYKISPVGYRTYDEAYHQGMRNASLKLLLVQTCQEEFENSGREEIYEAINEEEKAYRANPCTDREEHDMRLQEITDKRMKIKRRMMGNIKFVGELFRKSLLRETAVYLCVLSLMNLDPQTLKYKKGKHDEENLEALMKLLHVSGEALDKGKYTKQMESCYILMKDLANNKKISSRIRFMFGDLLERRKNNWELRIKEVKPTTKKEIRKSIHVEEAKISRNVSQRGGTVKEKPDMRQRQEHSGKGSFTPSIKDRDQKSEFRPGTMSKGDTKTPPYTHSQVPQGIPQKDKPKITKPSVKEVLPPSVKEPKQEIISDLRDPGQKLDLKMGNIIFEYISNKDLNELILCIKELPPGSIPAFIFKLCSKYLDCNETTRKGFNEVLRKISSVKGLLHKNDVSIGIKAILEDLADLSIDIPKAPEILGTLLGILLAHSLLYVPMIITNLNEMEVDSKLVDRVYASTLKSLINETPSLRTAISIGNAMGMSKCITMLYKNKEEGVRFLFREKIIMLYPGLYASHLLKDIDKNFASGNRNQGWLQKALLEANVVPAIQGNRHFMEILVMGLLKNENSELPSSKLLDELFSIVHPDQDKDMDIESFEAEEGVLWGCYSYVASSSAELQTGKHFMEVYEELQKVGLITPGGLRRWGKSLEKQRGKEPPPVLNVEIETRKKFAAEVFEAAMPQFTRVLGSDWMNVEEPYTTNDNSASVPTL